MRCLANLVLIMATGCGRLGFDAEAEISATVPDAGSAPGASDAAEAVRVGPCKASLPIADPVVAAGTIVEVPTFGSPTPEGGVTVEVSDSIGGTPFTSTTSAADGRYSLALASQGQPMQAVVSLRKAGMLTSVFVPDGPLDSDVIDMYSPITTDTTIGALYIAVGVSRSSSAGTLLVMVTDCDGAPVSDAVVTVTPAPSKMVYNDDAGSPDPTLVATRAYGLVHALNVGPGPVTITATKAGATFLSHEVEILSGDYVMGTRLRVVR